MEVEKRCPLCQELFPAGQLKEHVASESTAIRDLTIEVIKAQHPDWVANDGACPKCWEYYKKL